MKRIQKLRRLAVAQSRLRLLEAAATATAIRSRDEVEAEAAARLLNASSPLLDIALIYAVSSSRYINQEIETSRTKLRAQTESKTSAERLEKQIGISLSARIEQERIELERRSFLDFIDGIEVEREDEADAR